MNPWLESLGVALLAGAGVALARWISRLPKPYWFLGYLIPLLLVLLYAFASYMPAFIFVPPVSWIMMGRVKFAAFGTIAAMLLTTPLTRLPKRRMRIAVSVLIAVIVWQISIWPFLAPAFNRGYLSRLQTRIDAQGICRQSTDYNCGPAAAVTALRKLGLPAEEGEIAILTHASSATGTEPDVIAAELQKRYGPDGLTAQYLAFTNVLELKGACPVLAVVKFNFLIDHFVTVLAVTDKEVVVGDPLSGQTTLSHKEFEDQWRFLGVVLRRWE